MAKAKRKKKGSPDHITVTARCGLMSGLKDGKPHKFTTHVKPCPFCGGEDIDVGVASAQSFEVVCCNMKCRARIHRYIEYKLPRGVSKRKTSEKERCNLYDKYVIDQCVRAWNRRPKPKKIS